MEPGTAYGSAHDGALFGRELGADDGTSHCALLVHATVVVLFGSADGAATVETAATLIVLLQMVYCLTSNLA